MDVNIPQPGHQIRAFEIDDFGVIARRLLTAGQYLCDASVVHNDARLLERLRCNAVDQRRVAQDCSHALYRFVYSGFTPASCATLSQRRDSASIKARNSDALLPTGSMPRSLKVCTTSGARNVAAISPFRRSTTEEGVRAGASTPNHVPPVKPVTPASSIVGTSGASGERLGVATASALSLPARTCGSTTGIVSNVICT